MCPESSFVQLIHCLEHPQLTNVEKKMLNGLWKSYPCNKDIIYVSVRNMLSQMCSRVSSHPVLVVPAALHGSWILLCRLVVELDNHLCTYVHNNLLLLYTKGTFSYCCFAVVTVSSFREPGPVHMCLLGIT